MNATINKTRVKDSKPFDAHVSTSASYDGFNGRRIGITVLDPRRDEKKIVVSISLLNWEAKELIAQLSRMIESADNMEKENRK